MEKNDSPATNRIKKIQKIRELFCRLISDGSVQEVETFYRYFKKDLENSLWPVLKGPFKNIPIKSYYEPVFALKNRKDVQMFHLVLSLQPDINVRDFNKDKITALHGAVLSDDIMAASVFLFYGFDPEAKTKMGDTPFDKARSEAMRQVFRDFKQLDREAFALKYKLNVPQGRNIIEDHCEIVFPFSEMPTDLQREVIFKLDLPDLLLAPLVCKKWHELAAKYKNNLLPKLGKFRLRVDPAGESKVSFQIQLYPTVFHFCLANDLCYSPLKHNTDAHHLSVSPFSHLEADSAVEQEEILGRLKDLLSAKKYRVYWWKYMKQEIFIKLTENAGLGVISE